MERKEAKGALPKEAWTDYARYRAEIYRTASVAFFQEPSAEVLTVLLKAAESATTKGACVRESEQAFVSTLAHLDDSDLAGLRTSVATEYAELFVGPRAPLAPLYESVYVGADSRLCTEVTSSVRRFYRRFGMEAKRRGRIPDDHIAFELEFLANLCDSEADAVKKGDVNAAYDLQKAQLEFIVVHPSQWFGRFAERVEEAWCASYYRAWARFASSFVREDDIYLQRSLRDAGKLGVAA